MTITVTQADKIVEIIHEKIASMVNHTIWLTDSDPITAKFMERPVKNATYECYESICEALRIDEIEEES